MENCGKAVGIEDPIAGSNIWLYSANNVVDNAGRLNGDKAWVNPWKPRFTYTSRQFSKAARSAILSSSYSLDEKGPIATDNEDMATRLIKKIYHASVKRRQFLEAPHIVLSWVPVKSVSGNGVKSNHQSSTKKSTFGLSDELQNKRGPPNGNGFVSDVISGIGPRSTQAAAYDTRSPVYNVPLRKTHDTRQRKRDKQLSYYIQKFKNGQNVNNNSGIDKQGGEIWLQV